MTVEHERRACLRHHRVNHDGRKRIIMIVNRRTSSCQLKQGPKLQESGFKKGQYGQ